MFHLDTDTVIFLLRGNEQLSRRLESSLPDVGISTIVLAELHYGVQSSRSPVESTARLSFFLRSLRIIDFGKRAAEVYAQIRRSLTSRGRPIGEIDTLIASVAVANDAVFVTHNNKHYSQVEGLRVVDWLE